MKDFNTVLNDQQKQSLSSLLSNTKNQKQQLKNNYYNHHHGLTQQQLKDFKQHFQSSQKQPQMSLFKAYLYYYSDKTIQFSSPFLLSILTGPLTTLSILMQVSQKPFLRPKSFQSTGKLISVLGKNGMMGQNTIYKSQKVFGIHDGLQKLGKQGLRGMYKGNLTGIIAMSLNTYIRNFLYQFINNPSFQSTYSQTFKTGATVLLCSIADFITLPLMMCQSRLILQNSLSNFRTYTHFYDILRKTSLKQWFAGSSLLIFKNLLTNLAWLNFIPQSKVYSFALSTIISHLLSYPFITIIRNLQTNQGYYRTMMMNQRNQSLKNCMKRIYKSNGVFGFYRGFIPYALVHTFMTIIMIEQNVKSGYFDMIQ